MKQAALSSYYASSAFEPPEEFPLPSDFLGGFGFGFGCQLVDILDEIEREEGFGGKVNWYVAAIKCEELMMEEIQLSVEGGYEFTLSEMQSEFTSIIKDCD